MSVVLVCQLLQLSSKEVDEIGTTWLSDAVLREANHKNFIVCYQRFSTVHWTKWRKKLCFELILCNMFTAYCCLMRNISHSMYILDVCQMEYNPVLRENLQFLRKGSVLFSLHISVKWIKFLSYTEKECDHL